jgi:hypothetical protein
LTVNGTAANGPGTSSYYGTPTTVSYAISRTNYTDSGSGLASSVLTREEAPLASSDGVADGTCGAYGAPTTIAANPTQNAAAGITTAHCYRYILSGTDNVGNSVSITTIVKVDTTAPSFGSPALTLAASGSFAFYTGSGTSAYYNGNTGTASSITVNAPNVDDDESGVDTVSFPSLSGFSGGGNDTTSPFSATYTWSTSSASGAQSVTTTSNSVVTSAATTFTLIRDVTAPAGGALTVNGTAASGVGTTSANTTGSFTIGTRTDYTETQSGTASGLVSSGLVRDQATLNADFTCGTFGSATTLVGSPAQSGLATGCYRYTLTGTDNVTNVASINTIVKVDTTAPTATNVVLGGDNNGLVGEDDTVTVTYSEVMDASTFCNTWANGTDESESGNGQVVVTITNSGANDVLTLAVSGCGTFKFGSVALGGDYVTTTRTYSGNGSNASAVDWNLAAKTLTITLGTPSGAGNPTAQAAAAPSYTANTGLKDRAGNTIGAGPYTGTSSRF